MRKFILQKNVLTALRRYFWRKPTRTALSVACFNQELECPVTAIENTFNISRDTINDAAGAGSFFLSSINNFSSSDFTILSVQQKKDVKKQVIQRFSDPKATTANPAIVVPLDRTQKQQIHLSSLITLTIMNYLKKFFRHSAFIAVGMFLLSSAAMAQTATISTDQADYPPGATVIITGTGFQAGEEVKLQVIHYLANGDNDTSAAHQPWYVTADANGNVSSNWVVPPDQDELGATLLLTADGQTSGLHAETTFTDAARCIQSVSVSASQTLCQNVAANPLTLTVTSGGTGNPLSLTYQWYSNTINFNSGGTSLGSAGQSATYTPSTTFAGTTYYYCVVTNSNGAGTCSGGSNVSNTVIITVNPSSTVSLSSATGTDNQTLCVNNAITNITYSIGGEATGATATGLPTGVTGNYSGGVFTISSTPSVTGTFNYKVTATGATCNGSATGTITVNANGTISLSSNAGTDNQTVCIGTTISSIQYSVGGTSTGATVSGLPSGVGYNFTGSNKVVISGTPTQSGVFNYTVTTSGSPCVNPTASGTITVNANTSITTDVSSPAAVCTGGTAPALSVVATGTNLTYKWYSNTTASNTGGTAISGETTSSYTPDVSTAGVYYFYVIVSGDCGSDQNSSVATVTVNANTSITTDVSSPATVCAGGTVPTLSVSAVGKNLAYQWYSNTSNSVIGGTSITGATNSSYTPGVSTAGTYYYFVVVHGDCGSDQNSSVATVIVNGLPNNSTASSGFNGSTICYGGTGTLTFDAIDATFVAPYSIQYTDGTNTWSQSISGASAITFNVAVNPTVTTNYSLVSITNGNGCTRTSAFGDNAAKITVRPQFTSGAISATGQTICYGGTPGIISNTTPASGGDGNITYSWRSSKDGYATAIAGATSPTYTPPAGLTTTTSYQRYANDGTCNTTPTQSTGTWTVTVRPQFTAGAINTTGQTICNGGDPSLIGNATAASGGDNTITYKWQSSVLGDFSDAVDIASSNSETYDPPSGLTQTTSYRRLAHDGTCNTSFIASTGVWTVTVNPLPTLSTASQEAAVCPNNGAVIDLTGLLSGSTNTITYNIGGGSSHTASNVVADGSGNGSFTTVDLIYANNGQTLTITSVEVTSSTPSCSQSFTIQATLTVKAPTDISDISADKTSWTYGCTTATITVTATGDGTLSYEWHHKYTAGGISDEIVGTNTSTYTVPELAGAGVHEYWVEVTGGCGIVESGHVTITINPQTADALNDGDVYYTGPSVAFTANTTSNTATFTLSAFIKNSDPNVNCGDIATARLSFFYRVSGTTPWNKVPNGQNLPVGYVDPQNPSKGGTAAVIAQLNIGNGTTELYDIEVIISGNYQGDPDDALSQITITQPDPAGTISGGARLNNTNSTGYVKGAYKSDIGFYVNFTMKNNKPQNPKGKVNLTVKSYNDRNGKLTSQLHIYNISSNAIASFTISGSKASFTSKANIVEVINCETGETSPIEGNCKLVMDLQDIVCGNNSQDLVGIVVYRNAGGIWYSNNYNSNGTTTPAAIYSGDINVSGSGVCIASVVNSQSTNNVMEQPLEIIPFSVKAFPNPTERSFNLLVNGDATQGVQIKVFDISGKQVYVNRGAANRLYQFGEHFPGGTYFIVIQQGDKRTTTKVVKQ